ncbi:NTP transferase domain-containing protein [Solimonas marina]|uniref:Phosphocholine cytidylyltransferase family protein n=1 Tax=Solimonas marina TaxID=2714601 RepID=A0A969WC48_9GAMM|nr:phosphocholine cytidylyltransferase family protein [Solimonas marina]NKF23313.1 phosphocholine cytidylyltransferase family protein [Solimonas marina]
MDDGHAGRAARARPGLRAVILSAGQGSRLLPLTEKRPKCLIDLSGRSLLEWQLLALRHAGVSEAVVVTGFAADQVDQMLAAHTPAGMTVRTVFNPFYNVSDNLATCWLIREELRDGGLILNGDTLIEPEIAMRLLSAPAAPVTVTIDRKGDYDADDMKVQTEDGQLRAIGKTLPMSIVDGESIGFLRFDADGAARFIADLERMMRSGEGIKLWYLSTINRLVQDGCEVRVESIEGLDWGEMDFLADVESNRALTAPWADRWLHPVSAGASLPTAAAR